MLLENTLQPLQKVVQEYYTGR
ncbi:hypothetical protein CY0110_16887 [Crocosphaera chwakensis CCY0110]|uniref:Uncharacterized protein n=1 Tax=Crocosphaera chwakensis CCY0110 TaxID=391612 RepID=A3II59_9CHRO|nr:hypothetical protein CY0110_16887 [Crocosphaera chwakensis CCY0110]